MCVWLHLRFVTQRGKTTAGRKRKRKKKSEDGEEWEEEEEEEGGEDEQQQESNFANMDFAGYETYRHSIYV